MKTVPNLADLHDVEALASAFRLQAHTMLDLLSNKDSYYDEHILWKPRGRGRRQVWSVRRPLRDIHRSIRDSLSMYGARTEIATAYWPGCSAIMNAEQHVAKRYVTVADISDFFGSIDSNRIRRVYEEHGCTEIVAHLLEELTSKDRALPQGSKCSPLVSNLTCNGLDRSLVECANGMSLTVTRYADDIAFSGDAPVPRATVADILGTNGFSLRKGSYRVFKKGKSQIVTGLCVADHEEKRVRLPRQYKRWLRLCCHYVLYNGVKGQADHVRRDPLKFAYWLRGNIVFAHSVEPDFSEPLMADVLPQIYEFIEEEWRKRREAEDMDRDEDYYYDCY